MFNEKAKPTDVASASVAQNGGLADNASAKGAYVVQCHDADGNLKWETEIDNTVVNVGLQDMNSKYFTGSAYTAAWYLGLITGPTGSVTIAPGDTMALHSGWTEFLNYSQTSRPTCTFGTPTTANPSQATNSASPATFSINGAGGIVTGAFLVNNNTKNGATGTLYSAAKFSSPGDRTVVSGDTLTVTYTLNLAG